MSEEQFDSFLDLNLDDVPEPRVVDGGREYQLKVEHTEIKESAGAKTAGQSMLQLRYSIVDEPDTQSVFENIMLPHADVDEEQNTMRKRQLKRLVESLGWDISSGFNIDEMVGETLWAVLEVDEYQGRQQNRVRKYMAPQD